MLFHYIYLLFALYAVHVVVFYALKLCFSFDVVQKEIKCNSNTNRNIDITLNGTKHSSKGKSYFKSCSGINEQI